MNNSPAMSSRKKSRGLSSSHPERVTHLLSLAQNGSSLGRPLFMATRGTAIHDESTFAANHCGGRNTLRLSTEVACPTCCWPMSQLPPADGEGESEQRRKQWVPMTAVLTSPVHPAPHCLGRRVPRRLPGSSLDPLGGPDLEQSHGSVEIAEPRIVGLAINLERAGSGSG